MDRTKRALGGRIANIIDKQGHWSQKLQNTPLLWSLKGSAYTQAKWGSGRFRLAMKV